MENKQTEQILPFEVILKDAEGLTRDNFWDQLQLRCPDSSKLFAAWWRQYGETNAIKSPLTGEVDIFDLPFEMQYGLFLRFFMDLCKQSLIYPFLNAEPILELIELEINGVWQKYGNPPTANQIVQMFVWVQLDYNNQD